MNRFSIQSVVLCVAMWLSVGVQAQVNCIVSSSNHHVVASEALPSCESLYPVARYGGDLEPWRIGVSLGYGQRENPLLNGDDISVYGALQLSWFGRRFFFDNGDLGWWLGSGRHWDLNLIAGVGGERSFFSNTNPLPISFVPDSGVVVSPSPIPVPEKTDQKREPPKRGVTVDAGVEWLYYGEIADVQVQLVTDVSGRHNGQELWLSLSHAVQRGRWELVPAMGLVWKSGQAGNYLYGVRHHEVSASRPFYKTGAVLNGFARLGVSYRINEHWKAVSFWQGMVFDRRIRRSPLVEKGQVHSWYLGVYYEF